MRHGDSVTKPDYYYYRYNNTQYVVSHVIRGKSRDACPAYRPMMLLPKFLLPCYPRPPMHRAAVLYSKPAAAPSCCPADAVININSPPSCELRRPILLLLPSLLCSKHPIQHRPMMLLPKFLLPCNLSSRVRRCTMYSKPAAAPLELLPCCCYQH